MSEKEEKKNHLVGILSSIGVHLAVLVLFLFVMGWTAPDPPLSELGSGVELNLGLDQEGSGDTQPDVSTATNEKQTVANIEEQQKSETPVEVKDAAKEEGTKPAEENLSSNDESSVAVKETKKEVKKPEKVEEKIESKPDEKTVVAVKKQNSTQVTQPAAKKEGERPKNPAGTSQGDDKNKAGDKGSPEGSLDPNAQYTGKPGSGGNGGGGNGFALNMSGWNWDVQPQAPKLPDNENGRIVFEITVDSDGEIIQIQTLQRGLSPEAERICKEEIQKRSLVRTSPGAAPERSKGRITFVLHTQ